MISRLSFKCENQRTLLSAIRCLEWVTGWNGCLDPTDSVPCALGSSRVKDSPSLSLALDCPSGSGHFRLRVEAENEAN